MKPWKFLILVGGIIGIIGFFMPFASGHDERANVHLGVSAWQLVRGIDSVKEVVDDAKQVEHATRAADKDIARNLEEGMSAVRGFAILAYFPAALLAILGALAVARGKLGRLGGLFAIMLGGASAGVWALLWAAAGQQKGEAVVKLEMGTHVLLIAGLLGLFGGLATIVSPDRG